MVREVKCLLQIFKKSDEVENVIKKFKNVQIVCEEINIDTAPEEI